MSLPNFLKAGDNAESLQSSGQFISLKDGESINLVLLTGVNPPKGEQATGSNCLISFNQYVIWINENDRPKTDDGSPMMSPIFPQISKNSKVDVGQVLGLKPRFRAMMLVTKENELSDNGITEYIWPMSISVWKQLSKLESAMGSLKGKVIRFEREGSGLKTAYSLISLGREVTINGDPETDLTQHVGPMEREEITEMLEKFGMWPPAGGDPLDDGDKGSYISI